MAKWEPTKAYRNDEFLQSDDARTVRILSEFYEPNARFMRNNIVDTIVFFGSAKIKSKREAQKELKRVKAGKDSLGNKYDKELSKAEHMLRMSRYYEEAVELSKRLTEWSMSLPENGRRFIICSGGGPGIMEAANKGAKLAKGKSIGLNISGIPTEPAVNKYVTKDLAFVFHYYFMRKLWFSYFAKAFIAFPGGYGTMDELMEMLTLRQTHKLKRKMKIVVYDEEYWKSVINFDKMVEYGTVKEEDLKILSFCNSIDDVFDTVTDYLTKHVLNAE